MRIALAVVALTVFLSALPVSAQDYTAQTVSDFQKYCTGCHELSRVDIARDPAWWKETVDKMEMRYYGHFGAHIPVAEMTSIARYLAARSTFNAVCSKCHGADRPAGVSKDPEGWRETIDRMSGYYAKKFGQPISEADQLTVENYLNITAGKK